MSAMKQKLKFYGADKFKVGDIVCVATQYAKGATIFYEVISVKRRKDKVFYWFVYEVRNPDINSGNSTAKYTEDYLIRASHRRSALVNKLAAFDLEYAAFLESINAKT